MLRTCCIFTRRPPCSLAQTSMPPSVRGSTTVTCGSMKQWLTRGELIALLGQLEVCVLVNLVKLCAEGCIVFLGRCVIVRVEAELVAVANTSFDGLVGVLAVKAVSYAVKVKALVALYIIVYDCRAVLLVCLFGVEDIGQRLVFDLDELACGLGDLLGGLPQLPQRGRRRSEPYRRHGT